MRGGKREGRGGGRERKREGEEGGKGGREREVNEDGEVEGKEG